MRAYTRHGKRGFTLVELMIVVAIIGVLAALAIYGVRRYLATTKTAEAKNTIGAIVRSGVAAYERETYSNELLPDGSTSSVAMHAYCGSSSATPSSVPANKKYQPNTADGADFNGGDNLTSWKCLKFQLSEPIYYQYLYTQAAVPCGSPSGGGGTIAFEACAHGDLDGNGTTSTFARSAMNNNGQTKVSTEVYVLNEFE